MRSASVRLSWILSYLALLAVPIVVFLAVSWSTSTILEEQAADTNAALVDLMGKEIDGKLDYVGRLFNDVTWSPLTQSLMNQQNLGDGGVRFDLFRLSEALSGYDGYNRFAEFVFVYFPSFDGVLVPRSFYRFDQFRSIYFPEQELPDGGLKAQLTRRNEDRSLPLVYIDTLGHTRQAVAIFKSLPPSPSAPAAATICALIPVGSIVDSLHSTVRTSRSEIRVVGGDGQVLVSTLGDAGVKSGGRWRIGGENYGVLERKTHLFGWTVQLLVPDSFLKGKLLVAQLISVGGFLVCLALGGWLTMYLLRRNYTPVGRLVQRLSGGEPRNRDEDEFAFIDHAYSLAEERLERTKAPLRETLAGRLLRGQGEAGGVALEDTLATFDIVFVTPWFVVLLVQTEEEDGVLGELFFKQLEACVGATVLRTSDDHPLAFLINLPEAPTPATIPELKDKVVSCGQALRERGLTDLRFASALSAPVRDLGQIPTAWRQAKTALEYRFVVGGNQPFTWDELQLEKPSALYHFDGEREARLLTVVKAGDEKAAGEILDAIFAENTGLESPHLSPLAAQSLIWDLAATVMKALAEIADGDEGFIGLFEGIPALAQTPQLGKVQAGLRAVVDQACGYARARNLARSSQLKSQANREFIQRVCQYLQAEFRDPSLNLAKVADAQGLSPAYLSRVFRENLEEGILDYLGRLRVESVKNLLRTTKRNLQEIGLESGFTDVKTLIRTFRRFAGTTPGKYRETVA